MWLTHFVSSISITDNYAPAIRFAAAPPIRQDSRYLSISLPDHFGYQTSAVDLEGQARRQAALLANPRHAPLYARAHIQDKSVAGICSTRPM
jgi:hypothetical protein